MQAFTGFIICLFLNFTNICTAKRFSYGFRAVDDPSNNATDEVLQIKVASRVGCYSSCVSNQFCHSISFNERTGNCRHFARFFSEANKVSGFEQTHEIYYQRMDLQDCGGWKRVTKQSGVYWINPSRLLTLEVVCDMETADGGWTVIQRRYCGDVDFYRDWNSYKYGFGNLNSEFWIGNENIHTILSNGYYTLRIDLKDFEGNAAFAQYKTFLVGPENTSYTLEVGGYTGNAGDSMKRYQNGQKFSTKDKDNDIWIGNCAVEYSGAWWYGDCHQSNLNGVYLGGHHTSLGSGVIWKTWRGQTYSLKATKMMIRK